MYEERTKISIFHQLSLANSVQWQNAKISGLFWSFEARDVWNTYQVMKRKHFSPGICHLYRLALLYVSHFNNILSRRRAGLCWTEIKTNCLCESEFFPDPPMPAGAQSRCVMLSAEGQNSKLLQSMKKSCQFVKVPTWKKPGVLILFDEKAQAIEHNIRGWNTTLFQSVRMHLVPDWLGVLTDM